MTDVAQGPQAPGTAAGPLLTPRQFQHLTHDHLLRHSAQLQNHGSMQSARLPRQSSQPLSHQSSAALSQHSSGLLQQHASGQLQQQIPSHLVQTHLAAYLSHLPAGPASQHASGQLNCQSSGQMSQHPSGQLASRQASGHMGSDLITQGLRGSQIALELQAAEHAQQQAAAAAASGVTTAAPATSQPLLPSQSGYGLPNQAMPSTTALPNQATAPEVQADAGGKADSSAFQQMPVTAHLLHAPLLQVRNTTASDSLTASLEGQQQ